MTELHLTQAQAMEAIRQERSAVHLCVGLDDDVTQQEAADYLEKHAPTELRRIRQARQAISQVDILSEFADMRTINLAAAVLTKHNLGWCQAADNPEANQIIYTVVCTSHGLERHVVTEQRSRYRLLALERQEDYLIVVYEHSIDGQVRVWTKKMNI